MSGVPEEISLKTLPPNQEISSWTSPQSIYTLGHPAVRDLFTVPVQIQEKVDGSFLAFGVYGEELRIRSKGAMIDEFNPPKLFAPAVEFIRDIQHELKPEFQYRGECVSSPRHNVLKYDRTPNGFVILFDILEEHEEYFGYEGLVTEARRLGLEVVPQLMVTKPGEITNETLTKLLDTQAYLGGNKVEGLVFKPLVPMYGPDKKMLFSKFVSEEFKEIHRKEWRGSNPTRGDVIQVLGESLRTEARWNKAVQHLAEAGELESSPRDIGKLIKEIQSDVKKEAEELVKDKLWKWAWPQLQRKCTVGLPQWYKERLLERQFDSNDGSVDTDS